MPLVKCPDCEKMVSPRAKQCLFCGCPAKFFINGEISQNNNEEKIGKLNETEQIKAVSEPEVVSAKKVKFQFGRYSVSYPEKGAAYAALFGTYLQTADMAYEQMLNLYKEAGSIGKALESMPNEANKFIFGLIDKGTEYLYSQGVYITQEEFFEKYDHIYTMDYDRYYSVTLEKYSEILDMKKEMAAYRETIKMSRGRWQGGGFGVKGAIKGAVTASALNMGSDFLHSFGDSSREKKDNEEIRKKLRALYEDSERQLCHSVKTCMMNVYKAMRKELEAVNAFEEIIRLKPNKAKTIYENTKKYETDVDVIKRNMLKCITLYPGEKEYYRVFFDDFMNTKTDIKDFLAFWHLEYLLSDILDKRDKQDEFADFMLQKGIKEFDFNNLTAENVVKLWSWLDEYAQDVPKDGKWAKIVSKYLEQFSTNQKERQKEILVDYLPLDYNFLEFYSACVKHQQWLDMGPLRTFFTDITSESNRIRKYLEADRDYVQLYCDTSLTEMGSKGLAITGRYVVDLKSHSRIKISEIREVNVEQVGEYKFELQFSDGTQEIRFFCEEIREYEAAAYYLKNYLKAVFIRFGKNKFLSSSLMQSEQFAIEEQSLDKESAEEYFNYIKKYQKDTGKLVDLEFCNMFRRRFKSIWTKYAYVLKKENVINQYDYKLSNQYVLQRIGDNLYGQYILISTNDFTLTDRNIYFLGRQYDLVDVKEIILFADMQENDKGLFYIVMDKNIETLFFDRHYAKYLDEILYMIDIALEELQTQNVKIHYDVETLFCCEECRSIDVKQGLISWRCEKCGNKKYKKMSKIVPELEDREISNYRKSANGSALSSDERKQALVDEEIHSLWIKSRENM